MPSVFKKMECLSLMKLMFEFLEHLSTADPIEEALATVYRFKRDPLFFREPGLPVRHPHLSVRVRTR